MEAASTSGRGCQGSTGQCSWRRGRCTQPARLLALRVSAVQVGRVRREPVPEPKREPGVVAGTRTKPTPLLSIAQMVERMERTMHEYGNEHYAAFYSSAAGGIVVDPAVMLIPIDDQFVSKGYGVAETLILRDGFVYMLDEHIERVIESCRKLGIELPYTVPGIKRIVLDTAAASGKMNGQLRLWITPGRGGFSPLQLPELEPALYVLCLSDTYEMDRTKAWDAAVAQQPVQATVVTNILGNQHLLTSTAQAQAAANECQVAIFTDGEGFVQHCAGYTVCILTQSDILVYPPFDYTAPSITLQRVLELIPAERERSPDDVIVASVQQRRLHVSELLAAKECFLINTTYTIAPVKSVDGKAIADGVTGLTTLALHYMLDNDQLPPRLGQRSARHTPVPYGYTTGMRTQLT